MQQVVNAYVNAMSFKDTMSLLKLHSIHSICPASGCVAPYDQAGDWPPHRLGETSSSSGYQYTVHVRAWGLLI